MLRLVIATLLGLSSLFAHAQSGAVSEYGLKAVLLFKLPQFVYWPQGDKLPTTPVLCVQGANPFGGTLLQLVRNTGIPTEIRQIEGSAGYAGCNILFISRSEAAQMDSLLQRPALRNILTVSDIPGFARAGGMVELVLEGDTVGINLNRKVAQRQGLDFNAQLLRLAQRVEQ
ncbi:MAG: YfiR family protein [Sulfuricella sp.]|nr:YfiR family protein [Sulfuricella sp.]